MFLSMLPNTIHHHIFQYLEDEDLEALKAIGDQSIARSLSSMWIDAQVRGVVCPYSNMTVVQSKMTGNLYRTRFRITRQCQNLVAYPQYCPNTMETKALEVRFQRIKICEFPANLHHFIVEHCPTQLPGIKWI